MDRGVRGESLSASRGQQGLVFGEVASLYDRSRPSYPDEIFEEIEGFAGSGPGPRVLEIGAGTGKATQQMARRGWSVLALEPSAPMARLARANLASSPMVRVVEAHFEAWDPMDEAFSVVCAAQSWHWVDPVVGYPKAARVMKQDGTLALIWNRALGGDDEIRKELDRVYHRFAPGISSTPPSERQGDRGLAISSSGLFGPVTRIRVPWTLAYSGRTYTELMSTQSDHRLLEVVVLDRLLAKVEEVIENRGGFYRVDYVTLVYLARRLPDGQRFG